MTAPLDGTPVAEFDPTAEQVAAVNVSLPPAGTRNTIPQPVGDNARVVLGANTEFSQVCVIRQADTVVVTAQGYGQLAIVNSPPNSPNPPEVADARGQVVRAETIGAGCGLPGGGLAAIAPAAGGVNPAALAAIAPAAGAAGAAAAAGGEASGGHFNSTFDPSAFLGLNYGPVDPLRFDRGPPILDPGFGLNNEGEPLSPPPPPPPPVLQPDQDLLDMRSNSAVAAIPTPAPPPVWVALGNPISDTTLVTNEGISVYTSGFGNLVGAPAAASVRLETGADVTITLINENAGFRNITGYYTYDDTGKITDAHILWLNSAPDGGSTEVDFFGKTGDLTKTFHVDSTTNLGFFEIADGGGDGVLTNFGILGRLATLFSSLGIDPTTLPNSDRIVDFINDHLRYDPVTRTIQADLDGNPNNGDAGWTSLAAFVYLSHDPSLNTDFGMSNLTGTAQSHTVSGVANGQLIIGFEDLPFVGTADSATAPTSFTPGAGYPPGVTPVDFDYNDTIFAVTVKYTPVEIQPGVWSPLTAIDSTLNGGVGSIARVQFDVAGLGDGVALNFGTLSSGWVLQGAGIDAAGNGLYTLSAPGGSASSAAFVSELSKLQITVDESTPTSHQNVTIAFTATDTDGLTDTSQSVLDFSTAGLSPPVTPDVTVDAGPIPPASPTIEQLLTT